MLPQIAHLSQTVLLKEHFLVKLSSTFKDQGCHFVKNSNQFLVCLKIKCIYIKLVFA